MTDGARVTTRAATGTLTKKAQRQESRSVRSPPRIAPSGEARGHQGAVEAEGAFAQRALLERGGQQGESGRGDGRRGEALEDPGGEEDLGRGRQSAERRGEAEHDHAAHEEALAAHEVGDAAEQEGESGGGQGEGGGDPLKVREREAESFADDGQCDVQDREVHGDHELGAEKEGEDELLPPGHTGSHAAGPQRERSRRVAGSGWVRTWSSFLGREF